MPADAQRLVTSVAKQYEFAHAFELCRTRDDRPTPALRISQAENERPYGIWIQARQHAWESGSSWVCRGLTQWLVGDDPRAASLRRQAQIYIVPIMDIDNVAIGAGGKNQKPHDHNRDWGEQPHWRATAAAMKLITAQDKARRFDLFVDLHNPDAGAKEPFYFVTPRELLAGVGRPKPGPVRGGPRGKTSVVRCVSEAGFVPLVPTTIVAGNTSARIGCRATHTITWLPSRSKPRGIRLTATSRVTPRSGGSWDWRSNGTCAPSRGKLNDHHAASPPFHSLAAAGRVDLRDVCRRDAARPISVARSLLRVV